MPLDITVLADGVDGYFIKNSRFNTTLISFNFYVPLNGETVADYALLPFLLTTCGNKYPDFSKLNYKLSKLYGAELIASAEKAGDFQLLKIGVSVINDKYTLDNEELVSQACELLMSLIFEPKVENGAFCKEDTEREKRKAVEHILGELGQKRTYAKTRLIEEMYKNSPFGVPKCGTPEQVNAITGESLYKSWQDLLKSAYIRVNVISSDIPVGLFDNISERFSGNGRENLIVSRHSEPTEKAEKVDYINETMDIAQGKLAMGFSSKLYGGDATTASLILMCDIFGGGPYSRLFNNVREKMSLCYYCSSDSIRGKGLLTVSSGIEAKNLDKTIKAILDELDVMKRGEFTDSEFEASKKNILDSFKTYNDSQSLLDVWYSLKIFDDKPFSPEEYAELISKVTKNEVAETAKGINLHTVFSLLPENKKEEDR